MTFEKTLAWVKKEVEQHLEKFFVDKRKVASRVDPHCVELVDQVADVTMRGGKRIRAYLCWLGYQSVIPANAGIQSTKNWIPDQVGDDKQLSAMVGLELFHSFALIHDDIMDQDKERRGGLTVHEYFKSQIINPNDQKRQRYGESMAILAGDLALAWADEMITEAIVYSSSDESSRSREVSSKSSRFVPTEVGTRSNNKVIIIYQKMKDEVIYGQTLDVMQMHQVADVPQQTINELKTAWYTVIRPLQIGASLAGASTSTLELLAEFGLPVGLLFQLKDDVLDGALVPSAFEKAVHPLRARAARALGALHLSQEMQSQCDSLVRFVTERTF